MFMNFWYVAGFSADVVADKPLKSRMLGFDFVLFRDRGGKVNCLSNICTHRGGSLAGGKTVGDCVQCPYHGWQFDGAGECVKIPSIGKDGKIPARTRIDSYPVQERYGMVFVFLGDLPEAERPPITEIPEYGQDGWRATNQVRERRVHFMRAIENGVDPAHNEFVHDTHGFQGERDDYKVGDLDMRETPWGIGFWNKMHAPPLADGKMRAASGRTEAAFIDTGTGHHGPCSLWTYIHPTPQVKIHQYSFQTPIEEDVTRAYLVTMRNFLTTPEHDARMIERNFYVAGQDDTVLVDLEPVVSPRTNSHEVFMPADVPAARYREFCRAWEANGWRIDTAQMYADRGRIAYAIPSPARRTSKGWVIDPVPMLPGSDIAKVAAE
ncbi:MAG: aromatic ring-hydroxylating dioxygenase subunit alpha [Rhodobacteraceae bacterium]|nr:aromatic ring-hydroxylating dioxygenase subunit alpha [Paracoccaceae bacterium]